jgi:hypothetical protein
MRHSLRKLLPPKVRRRLAALRNHIVGRRLVARAERRLNAPGAGRVPALAGELIVSLTSYPPRFGTLHLTLGCLLDQSVKADRVVLWIGNDDIGKLPNAVRRLEDRGLEIRVCDDLRSFKKLVPAVEAFPDAFIVTADDDLYYPRDWLETLVNGMEERAVVCHRAHRINHLASGQIAPYVQWEIDIQDAKARRPSSDILPTGGAGALYPPYSLGPRVTDRALFQRLCPDGDDLWFYWCARMAGTLHKKVGGRMRLLMWPSSQKSSLWESNETGGNDRMIAALEHEFYSVGRSQ